MSIRSECGFVQTSQEGVDRELAEYGAISHQLFINKPERILLEYSKNHRFAKEPEVSVVEDGIILPLIRDTAADTRNGVYLGGVCDKEYDFITGFDRRGGLVSNFTCMKSYRPENISLQDEEVIFGGVFIGAFGHLISECLSRLWYVVKNQDDRRRIAVLAIPDYDVVLAPFLELLDIERERVFFVEKPTGFKRIVIPEQSVRIWCDYSETNRVVYEYMRNKAREGNDKKVYLTRSAFTRPDGTSDCLNELFFEDFFRKRGFSVISPEKLALREQVSVMAGAEHVITTEGTMSHLAVFCKEGTKLTILRRADNSGPLIPQILINKMNRLDVSYIDISMNPLPTKHTGGVFLFGPTAYFRQWCQCNGISYSDEEFRFDKGRYLEQYTRLWTDNYSEQRAFNTISALTIKDVIKQLNAYYGKTADLSRLETKQEKLGRENSSLKKKLKRRERESEELKERVQELETQNRQLAFLLQQTEPIVNYDKDKQSLHVIYNSGARKANGPCLLPGFEENGTLSRKKVSYDFVRSDQAVIVNDGKSAFGKNMFVPEEGSVFAGWKLRVKAGGTWLIQLADGGYQYQEDYQKARDGQRMIYKPKQRIPAIPFRDIKSLVIEAEWKQNKPFWTRR